MLGWPFHLAQAAAMTVNPAVAFTAAIGHHRSKNICFTTIKRVLPLSILFISLAAWLSNQLEAPWLEASFGLFLLWVLWDQISALRPNEDAAREMPHGTMNEPGWTRAGLTGGITGSAAGLLGIGGGLIQVPLLNRLCKLPLRKAIGSSSAIMFFTALIGATVKDLSLSEIMSDSGSHQTVWG